MLALPARLAASGYCEEVSPQRRKERKGRKEEPKLSGISFALFASLAPLR
jgi:hypothetical protein